MDIFEKILIRDLPMFQPFYHNWKLVDRESELMFDFCFQNPFLKNSYVGTYQDDVNFEVFFVYTNIYEDDRPTFHRLMGPAHYYVVDGKIKDVEWWLFDKQYDEFEYWSRVCQIFAAETQLSLSMDECRLWIENEKRLPFPSRLNLKIGDLEDTEDEDRTKLDAHAVWEIKGKTVSVETFWTYWEQRSKAEIRMYS